jgi:predicted nucleotidyltransferase
MPVVGIIAEYNPLHNGHAHHLEHVRNFSGTEGIVCVLSSNFVQRGEPALLSKWARTRMALAAGADLVLELPSAFSCSSAEYFASGGVSILNSLGIIDCLSFGSEEGDVDVLETAADILAFEDENFREILKQELDKGLSFAVARQNALKTLLASMPGQNIENAAEAISQPNNILGIEYIKAIKRFNSNIKPMTIRRKGQGYKSLDRSSSFSSATAIRHHIRELADLKAICNDPFLKSNMTEACLKILMHEIKNERHPIFPEHYSDIILHSFRNLPAEKIAALPYIEDGLENRLRRAAIESVSVDEMVSKVVTSRYPASRIKRILISMLTGMTAEFLDELKANGYAQYIRVLGFNDTGRSMLSQMRKKASLPIIVKPAGYKKLDTLAKKLFEHEIRSTDAYVLGYRSPGQRIGGQEYTSSPVCSSTII